MNSKVFNRIATELSDTNALSRAIAKHKPVQRRSQDGYVAPETELQQSLASLWAEFLKIDQIGLEDNFFELGGDSLIAMQITFQIHERFHVEFPLEVFVMTPVLKQEAEKIEEMLFQQANEGILEQLLDEMDREPDSD